MAKRMANKPSMMKPKKAGNRQLFYFLAILALIAIIWRVLGPATLKPAGPISKFPAWRSTHAFGDLGAHAVSPSGTIWAGAWNDNSRKKELSAVWFVDFDKYEAQICEFPAGSSIADVNWVDDKTVRVVRPKADDQVAYINAETGKIDRSIKLKTPISQVICWPDKSDKFLAELVGEGSSVKLAVLSESGEVLNKEVTFELPKNGEFYMDAGLSPDGGACMFSVLDDSAGGGRAYYFADMRQGTVKHAFDLKDIPGHLNGIWISPAGALLACSDRDKCSTLLYDPAAGKLNAPAGGSLPDMAAKWPDAPKNIMFATLTGGYDFDIAAGKSKMIFKFKAQNDKDIYWREGVQGGRLYSLKNGNYIAVGTPGRYIDIRELDNKGEYVRDILPR